MADYGGNKMFPGLMKPDVAAKNSEEGRDQLDAIRRKNRQETINSIKSFFGGGDKKKDEPGQSI